MAIELRNAPRQAGYALLVFDRDIDANPLRLAIYNRMSGTYLGRSVGKANWSPACSHYFDAALTSRVDGKTVFKLGPDVTTFVPDETTIELRSEDGAIREAVVWSGILLDFHWTGPDDDPDEEERRRRDEDRLSREREAEAEKQRQAADEAKQRANAKAAADEAARKQVEDNEKNRREIEKRDAEENERQRLAELKRQREAEEASRETMVQLAAELAVEVAAQGAEAKPAGDIPIDKKRRFDVKAVIALVAVLLVVIAWGSRNKSFLCLHFGMFCEGTVFDDAAMCVATSCGADRCFVDYRNRYPNGRYATQIPQLLADREPACREIANEQEATDRAEACAAPLRCGADRCLADYRHDFPRGVHRVQIELIGVDKGSACARAAIESGRLWDHNGSVVSLTVDGASRKFYYKHVRQGMVSQGVAEGTLLFDGRQNADQYSGTAYVFSKTCGPASYNAAGDVTNDSKTVTLRGRAPRRNDRCETTGYRDDVLVFDLKD